MSMDLEVCLLVDVATSLHVLPFVEFFLIDEQVERHAN